MTGKNGVYFSVSPMEGFRSVKREYGDYMNQSEPARDYRNPTQPLGKVRVFMEGDEFWGGSQSRNYYGKVLENPTWRQIAAEAGKAMKVTRDYHHSFLECLEVTDEVDEDGVRTVKLWMGS
jgi:hypothetical protein